MRVINLQAENFKILRAVEIKPEGDMVTIRGENEQGKSAVLDAIWVALAGRAVAPPMPIRKGEEQCRIRLDLGELIVTRTFTDKEGKLTDTVKVESGDGTQRYNKPQTVLDALMGQLGFDPLAFVQMKPDEQADTLLTMVPLPIDLEALARKDTADMEARRDINRDAAALKAQIDAIPADEDVPAERVDRDALTQKLADAAGTNSEIERERYRREALVAEIERVVGHGRTARDRIENLKRQIEEAEAEAEAAEKQAAGLRVEYDKLPALAEPVDTQKLREDMAAAEATNARIDRQARRLALLAQHGEKLEASQALTDAMAAREKERQDALKGAKMPLASLGFAINEKGKPVVTLDGVPFEQASTAQQIKASTAIAMETNPELRVLRIKDGSLLDSKSMAIIADMAKDNDFQLWVEVVGSEGVGIVIEAGEVKGAAKPKGEEKAKAGNDGQLL